MTFRIAALFALLLLPTLSIADDADDSAAVHASAYVQTLPARQGELPHTLIAFGTAASAPDATTTMNVQAPGSVARFAVALGEQVKRGQALLQFDLAPSAKASFNQAQTSLSVAQEAQRHTTQLLAQQLATRDQLAQADKAVADAHSALNALSQQQGSKSTVILVAPYDGVVSSLSANRGDQLQPGAPLLTVTRTDGVWVNTGMEASDREAVHVGSRVLLHPLDGGAAIPGTVHSMGGMLNPRTRLVDLYIAPLKPVLLGEAFRVEVVIGVWKGWIVPRDAVISNDGGWSVFQIADGKAVKVPVTVVGESDSSTAVAGALDGHRPIVTTGATQLDDGTPVRTDTGTSKQ